MGEMGERLKAARGRLFKSARSAAARHNWAASTYAAHENGQNDFGKDEAKLYGKAFKTNWIWLLDGEGEPGWKDKDIAPQYDVNPDVLAGLEKVAYQGFIREIDVKAGLGGGGSVDQNLAWENGQQTDPLKPDAWKFPEPFLHNELRRSADRVKILETFGDSMAPTIQSGDRVIIDTDHVVPSPDGLYAVRDRYGSIVIKRLQVLRRGDPPTIRIISDNKAHDAEDVGADEIAIVGRVLWSLKRL